MVVHRAATPAVLVRLMGLSRGEAADPDLLDEEVSE
jgi:hypothetical protein